MRTDSGKIDDHANRRNNWDKPDGLGWQLWLRNRTFGLSSESIQRQVERFRSNGLFRSPSLCDDIQRRWQISRKQGPYPFNSELLLFSARSSFPFTQSPARHFQTYPQHVSNSPAHLLPSRTYSHGLATGAPQTKNFSGYSILRKKGATVPTKRENSKRSAVPVIEPPAKHREEFNSLEETALLPVDKKKVSGFEPLQFIADKTLHLDDSPTSVTNEPFLLHDARQLKGSVSQNEAIQKNRDTAEPLGDKPPVQMRSTRSLYKLPSQKSIVQHILRRWSAPNLFHSASPGKIQDRSPVYFAGHLKLSDPIFRKTTPLLFRSPLQRVTDYEKDHNSAQTVSNLTGQSENVIVEVAKIRPDPIGAAVHDVISLNRSGSHTGFSTPLTSLLFNKLIAPSRQTAQSPSARKQQPTGQELTVAKKLPDTIASWLSPTPYSELNKKSTYPEGQSSNNIVGMSTKPTDPIKQAVHDVLSRKWSGRNTGFSTPLTSLLFNKPITISRQTADYSLSRKKNLTGKELTAAKQVPDTIATWLSPAPYSELNRKGTFSGSQSKSGGDPTKTAVHNVLSHNWSGSHTGFPTPLTSQLYSKPVSPSKQAAHYPSSRRQPLAGKYLTAAKQVPDTTATWLSPTPYSALNKKSTYPEYDTIQRLSDPAKKNTPTLHAMSPQPSSSFSALTLQLAGRVTEDTMKKGKSLRNLYHNKSIIDLSSDIKKIAKARVHPSVPSSPPMSHSLKSVAHSLHDRSSFSYFPEVITGPANRQYAMSFTNHLLFPKHSPLPLFENAVPNKANELALSPKILGHTESSMKYSDVSGKRGPNIIADIFMASQPPYSALQRATTVKSDDTLEQPVRVKNDFKELTHPVKSQRVSRYFSMDSLVQPSNSWPLYAKTPNLGNDSPKQYKNRSSQGVTAYRQLTFPQIQRKSTEAKISDGFNIPHNLMVQQRSVANTGPLDIYDKILRTPNLNVVKNHIFLSEAGTMPSTIAIQASAPASPDIVEHHENALFYPEAQKSSVRYFTNNATSNLANSRLFLKLPASSVAGQAPSQQTLRVHSKNESSIKRSFVGQDMPLAPIPSSQGAAHSFSNNASDSQIVQTSLLNLAEDTPTAGVASAPSADTGPESSTSKVAAGPPQAAIDIDELVEKTWLKIMRKLTIERERRGHNKWS